MDEKKISSERLLVDCKDPDEGQGVVIMLEGEEKESKLQFTEISSEELVRIFRSACFLLINYYCRRLWTKRWLVLWLCSVLSTEEVLTLQKGFYKMSLNRV